MISRLLSIVVVSLMLAQGAPPASPLLGRAFELADLNNWADAEPEFAKAAAAFRKTGDRQNLAYAELGIIRATIQRRNLLETSALLQRRLDSDPLLRDPGLRLFCLAIKGEIDGEMESRSMRRDWAEVAQLAKELGNAKWQYRALAEIGMVAFYEGDVETARKNVGGALLAATNAHDVGAMVRDLYAIGLGLNAMKMDTEAATYLDKAITLSEKTPGAPYPYSVYLAKADLIAQTGQTESARKTVNNILDTARKQQASSYEALALISLAGIDSTQSRAPDAASALLQAIKVCEMHRYSRLEAEAKLTLANVYRSQGDVTKAESLLTEATVATQRNGALYLLPQRLQILAALQAQRGEFIQAGRTLDRAAAFVDTSIGNDSAILDKTAWVKSVSDMYVQHLALVAEHLPSPQKAYDIIEQVRGRVLTDLLLGGSEAPSEARANEAAISHLRLRLFAARTTGEVQNIRDQIFSLEQARWVTPDVSILKSRTYSRVPLSRLQQVLSGNAAILEYVLADPVSYCLVIRQNTARIVRLAPKQRIDTLVASYLKEVKERRAGQLEGHVLYETLLTPLADDARVADLMIVRDGSLNRLPFDSLRDASASYVGQGTVVSYLPSAGSFYLLAEQARRPVHDKKVLAVGGVPYRQDAEHFRSVASAEGFRELPLIDLPNSTREALEATATVPDIDKTVLIGSAATESALKKALTASYRVIHLAVHSVVDERQPERAALILRGDSQTGDDGLLQAPEIVQLRLRAQLVVLSACDTSVGPLQGQEGVATLSRSFFLAGAQNVVSTLWSIDDSSSVALLKQFYIHLGSGQPAATALATAKRDMLATFGERAVPFYWAAFTYEGVPETAIRFHDQKPNERGVARLETASGDRRGY
jgi:CHAT domain-containing protein